jgi:hypothetical protein
MTIQEYQNIGKSKYVISWHDNKYHPDGSPFYDIRIFKNLKDKNNFIKQLNKITK